MTTTSEDYSFSQEDVLQLAFDNAYAGLRAFARGEGRVLTDESGAVIGAAWPSEDGDCEDSILWEE